MRANRSRCLCPAGFLAVLVSTLASANALAQQQPQGNALPNPRLLTISPSGGKAGTTIEVTFTGQDVEEPQGLLFSHPAIKAEPIQPPPPPPPDPKKPMPKPMTSPGVTSFKVTIPGDVPVGMHDVRLVNKWGVSNPRAFAVGDLAEAMEKEPNNDVPQAQRVEMNTTVNGSIASPTDVDYFVFAGKKGQRVVVSCLTSSIDSRLHAGLEIYDSTGKRLAFNRGYLHGDALTDVTPTVDGDYLVRLYKFTHTEGGPEHFYRLSITTAPWIDAIFPPVVEGGKATPVVVFGRNLPGGKLDPSAVVGDSVLETGSVVLNAPGDPLALQRLTSSGRVAPPTAGLDGFDFRLRNPAGSSNAFLLTYARAPVVLDNGTNDKAEAAQEVPVPCEIAGRVEKKRDRDWYAFTAKKGDTYLLEAFSDRLGAPADLYMLVRKLDTKQDISELDDTPETLSPVKFFTRTDDPASYRFTAPADGKYHLLVTTRDADVRATPRIYYRVRITPETPDFRLVVMPPADHRPDTCVVRQGGNNYFTVLVWRQDGWNGEVSLQMEGLPAGVTCPPQVLGKGMKQAPLVVSAADSAAPWTGEVRVKGTATINGQTVVREARPASITWPVQQQQNIPAIARLDRGLVLAVRDKPPFALTASLDKLIVTQGTKLNATFKVARLWPDLKVPVAVTAIDLPPNVTFNNNNQPVNVAADKTDGTAVVEVKANVVPGTYNLVLRGQAQVPFAKDPMAKQKPNTNIVYPAVPLTLTVLPNQVANLSVANANVPLKVGTQAEVVVKVARLHDFGGEFTVELVLPPNIKGVTADKVTIPAGKEEAKFVVRAADDAPPGNHGNLVVRATAVQQGNTSTTHETKITINVMK